MVSDASKKKAAAAAKRGGKAAPASSSSSSSAAAAADKAANDVAALKLSDRTCTGVLASHPLSRDIHIESLSLTFHGHDLIVDSELELNYGRRYGLLGLNGCGKSTLLTAIGCRELPIPEHMDIYHLSHEIEASDMSALEAVVCRDEERLKLEKEAEILSAQDDGGGDALDRIYERLEAIDASTAEKRAAEILFCLGFNKQMQAKKTRDFSGGWRMRIALARALFMNPTILLLDEPTNHLDLEACVWLEETLKQFDRILVVISHSQDFLNGVCTNIIHMQNKKLKLYTGNYDQYVQTRSELFGEIGQLLEETDVTPADVAENLMPMSKRKKRDANACLEGLVEALKKAKEEAAAKALADVKEHEKEAAENADAAQPKEGREEEGGKDSEGAKIDRARTADDMTTMGSPSLVQAGSNEWVLDTSSLIHHTFDLRLLHDLQDVVVHTLPARRRGSVQIERFKVPDVHYIQGGTRNVISVAQLARRHGLATIFEPTCAYVRNHATGQVVGRAHLSNGIYVLDYLFIQLVPTQLNYST